MINQDVNAIEVEEAYLAVSQNTAYGKITIYNVDTLEELYSVNGTEKFKNLGDRKIKITNGTLSSGEKVHYVYFYSIQPETELMNHFFLGRITIIEERSSVIFNGVSREVITRYFFKNFQSLEQRFSRVTETGTKSLWSSFDTFQVEDTTLFLMKQSNDHQIELAAQCTHNQFYTFKPFGDANMCQPCQKSEEDD